MKKITIVRSTIICFDKDGNYHRRIDNNGETAVSLRGNIDHMTSLDNQVKLAAGEAAAKEYINSPRCVDKGVSIVELTSIATHMIVKKK